jgi:ketosteroid isomerase-like protein
MTNTASVEARLAALEDKRDILRTLHSYAHCLDYGDEAGFIDCFTEDAFLGWSIVPGGLKGHARLREGFHQHTHAPQALHKHMLAEPRITLEGDRAKVHSMFFRLDPYKSSNSAPEIYAFGRYIDRLVRCKDGRWRFIERLVEKEAAREEKPLLAHEMNR